MATGDRIRVVLFITELALGGTPRRVQALAKGLKGSERFEPRVLSILPGGGVADAIRTEGIPVETLGVRSKADLGAAIRLWRYLRRVGPDILHAFNFHANLLAKVVGKRLARIPVVIVSDASVELAKPQIRVLWDRWTARWADAHYVNAKAIRETISRRDRERVPPDRIWMVPTGVDTEAFARRIADKDTRPDEGIKPGEKVMVSVGRLDKYKGQDFLLQALHLATKSGRPYRLILVGDGPRRQELEDMAKSLGIRDRVIFKGAQEDVRQYLALADLFVLASTEEGLPGSALESMSMKTTCLVTPTGGVTEAILDGKTGYVAQRDPVVFADSMSRLLENPEENNAVRQAARDQVEQYFNVESMVRRTEQMYEALVAAHPVGGMGGRAA